MENRSRQRARLAAALFAVSSLALLATTPAPPTARSEATGELYVAPGLPAHVDVRFTVADPQPDEITRLAINRMVGYDPDDRFESVVTAAIEGRGNPTPGSRDWFAIDLDPAACATGCEIVATIDAVWKGDPEPGLRVAWALELEVEYRSHVPEDGITRTTSSGGDAAPPRLAWLGIGALLAAAVGVGLWLTGRRLARLRLALAGGLLLVAAWPVVAFSHYLGRFLEGRLAFGTESVALLAAGLALGISVGIGMVRAARGRSTVLRVVGWMAALVLGYAWWAIAINLGTYRPHEMVAITASLGVFAGSAITSVPIGASTRARRSAGIGASLVMAIQAFLLAIALLVAGGAFAWLAIATVGGDVPNLAALGAVLTAIALAGLFVSGWLDWRRGSLRNIMIGNSVAVVTALGLGTIVLLQGEGGLLSTGVEIRVLAALLMITVLVGAIGLRVVDPPLADDERDGEGRQGDEIRRIADEEDDAGLGDRT